MRKSFIISPIILLVVWQLVSFFGIIDSFFLPPPFVVLAELASLSLTSVFLNNLVSTIFRTLLSFFLALLIGVPLGLFLGENEKIYRSVEFLIDFFRSMPATALFPLFLIIFGISDFSRISVAVFAALLVITFNTAYGVMHADKSRILAVKLMGAKKFEMFRKVIFWEALPPLFVGLRNAISLSLIIIIVTEMFIGTRTGIGYGIIDSQLRYNIPAMYSYILVAGVLGYLFNMGLLALEKKWIHWKNN